MRSVSPTLAGFWLVLAGCGGSTTDPAPSLSIAIPSSITSGTSVQANVTIGSGGGSPSNVTWLSSSPSIASVSPTGLVTGALKGKATISATSGNMTGQITVTVVPGAPASIVVYSGNGQVRPKGSQLLEPLCTNVLDAAGNLIIGVMVTYAVTTGAGTLAAPTAPVTDPAGIAISGLWTLGPNAGAQTVTASSVGAGSVTFTATAQ
jgi:hypothetical protein